MRCPRQIHDKLFEAGASLMIDQNRYCVELAKAAKLQRKPISDDLLSVWDGERVLFSSSRSSIVTATSMLWRYGLSLFSIKASVVTCVGCVLCVHVGDWALNCHGSLLLSRPCALLCRYF